jgi:hypothetical protein
LLEIFNGKIIKDKSLRIGFINLFPVSRIAPKAIKAKSQQIRLKFAV